MGRLDGKVIVVTGAGAGFGRGIVKKLTAEGAKVIAVDIHQANVEETASAAPQGSCVAHANDVTLESSWRDILEASLKNFGKIDVVVNCAGVVHIAAPSTEVPEDQFDLMFKVNVKPIYLSTKVIVPYWKEQKLAGSFINMSSISEPRPRPFVVWYAASKGAVTVATRGLAAEYAADNIRYNCIRPAVGETAMLAKVVGGTDSPEARKKILGTIPLGRVCQPEDVANMVTFLASDEANYLTGGAYNVDGGRDVS
ncbi:hypothetical protein H2198_009265 [Neophaeococcomyces mojaviensis]|uniref:Uncharacterized protein n=1 Tax=Neophaeococcomyces mojaviensis TaxID=3383035 RepID=A0ACC2ZUZ5_9EURO|nr:hypothetical protein H2198_009265 [Knufia sp. JES_112]